MPAERKVRRQTRRIVEVLRVEGAPGKERGGKNLLEGEDLTSVNSLLRQIKAQAQSGSTPPKK